MIKPIDDEAEADRYLCRAVVRSFQILGVFQRGEELRFCEVLRRCGLPRTVVFRMLHTLEHCGFIDRISKYRYRRRPYPMAPRLRTTLRVVAGPQRLTGT